MRKWATFRLGASGKKSWHKMWLLSQVDVTFLEGCGRTLGSAHAPFVCVHETGNRVESTFLPKIRIFIKHISISWTNNLINPYVKPYNVKNLHGRDFFSPLRIPPRPESLQYSVYSCITHTMILHISLYTAFEILNVCHFYSNISITHV